MRASRAFVVGATSGALLLAAGTAGCDRDTRPPEAPAVTEVSEPPATRPAPEPEPEPLAQYLDILLEENPDFPTTRPTSMPLALEEAAALVFEQPMLLDAVGCLWFHHERGLSPDQLSEDHLKRQTFVLNERVAFTWWKTGYDGRPAVELILQRSDGGYDWLHQTGRAQVPPLPAGREFDWSGAFLYGGGIAVPTNGGAAILLPVDRPDPAQFFRRYGRREGVRRPDGAGAVELRHVELAEPGEELPQTQLRLDGRGLVAWVPWTSRRRPGGTIARYIDGDWSPVAGGEWAERPVHLMPMTDGSILQLALDERGQANLTSVALNAAPVDPEAVQKLVSQLSDPDPRQRERAFIALANYGPGAWPVIESLMPEQPPVVQQQLEIILGDKTQPSLGGLLPEPGPVEVRQWLGDGGVILRFASGIRIPGDMGISLLERPAWILIRPGYRTRLLDRMLVSELTADPETRLFAWGDEWIVCRPGEAPKRWLINHFQPVMDSSLAEWQQFIGIDQVGRWVFRKPGQPTPTLLIDVRLPDPSPRLPTWVIETGSRGRAGWDEAGWPVTESGGAWRLKEEDWDPMTPEEDVHTSGEAGKGLATAPDGTIYDGGIEALEARRPDGSTVTWPLPPAAVGSGSAKAVVDSQGRIFLFNRPGRVVRIKPTPGAAEPFEVEAIFEEELPGGMPGHVWVDPAGRICATYFGTTLAVMWPDGQVPGSIRQKMPARHRGEGQPVNPLEGI